MSTTIFSLCLSVAESHLYSNFINVYTVEQPFLAPNWDGLIWSLMQSHNQVVFYHYSGNIQVSLIIILSNWTMSSCLLHLAHFWYVILCWFSKFFITIFMGGNMGGNTWIAAVLIVAFMIRIKGNYTKSITDCFQ